MEPLTFEDISTQALIESMNRYTGYIKDTTTFGWTTCSICKEVKTKCGEGRTCHLCPLFPDSWCRTHPSKSRLHYSWHTENDYLKNGTNSKERWMNDMANYVGLITRVIERRERTVDVDDCVIDYVIEAEFAIRVHMLTETLEGTTSNEMIELTSRIEDVRDWEKIKEMAETAIENADNRTQKRLK